MAACGLSEDQICDILPLGRHDFERHYRAAFANGLTEANVRVGAAVLEAAMDKRHPQFVQCATFWLRARAGWRDVRAVSAEQQVPEEQKQALINEIIMQIHQPQKVKG